MAEIKGMTFEALHFDENAARFGHYGFGAGAQQERVQVALDADIRWQLSPGGGERQIRLHIEGLWTLGQSRRAMDELAHSISQWKASAPSSVGPSVVAITDA